MFALSCLVSLLLGSSWVFALSPTFSSCQLQKPDNESPLTGCPEGTIFVSASDSRAQFKTVQEAVSSLPSEGGAIILIGEGQYNERVTVTRSGPLTLLGQLNSDALSPSSNLATRNLVQIWNNTFVENGLSDEQTAVLSVAPSGTSFASTDFKAYNIDFQNRAADYAISQALVTDLEHTNASFYGCTFSSFQDTWYTGHGASTYVYDSIIYGEVDYLFGFGIAWFENVTLANRGCGGGIVAWQGDTTAGNTYGAYISNSQVIRSPDANATLNIVGKCYLGRPWNDLARTVYLNSFMDDTIEPAGWRPWEIPGTIENTTFYAEYNNYGPGASTSQRVSDHILTATQAEEFTVEKVFVGTPQWVDFTYEV